MRGMASTFWKKVEAIIFGGKHKGVEALEEKKGVYGAIDTKNRTSE
ncbi:MAG: hypothetical protein VB084_13105 [Syntrophomonadaceae bacterium]|nr:hypothetical protein [Syntrophomonadaceae bacterium]